MRTAAERWLVFRNPHYHICQMELPRNRSKITRVAYTLAALFITLLSLPLQGYDLKGLLTGEWVTYHNASYGFSLSYPHNWRRFESGAEGSRGQEYQRLSLGDRWNSALTVEIREGLTPTLESAIQWAIEAHESARRDVPVVDMPYGAHTFPTRLYPGNGIKEVFVLRDNRIFLFRFVTNQPDRESALETFDRIMSSVVFTDTE